MSNTLPQEELIKLCKETMDPDWSRYSQEERDAFISKYREVEEETNEAIKRHGSVQAWYESGEGRLL